MISEYQVVFADNSVILGRLVNELIREGWQPYGIMQVGMYLYQPMIRGKIDNNEIQRTTSKCPIHGPLTTIQICEQCVEVVERC